MKRTLATVVAGFAVLSAATIARAQDDVEKLKQAAMKEKLEYLQEKTKELPDPGKDPLINFTFKDGLKFKSSDGKFEGAIGGRLYFNTRTIKEKFDGFGATNTSDFFTDTARIQIDTTFNKMWSVRVESEFSKTGSFFLKDGWMGWKGMDELNLKFGQFKEPFSQEETCSSRFIDFAERSIVNRLVPTHDIGVMVHGTFAEKMFEYEIGAFNGAGRNARDANDEKDLCARFRVTPFKSSSSDWINQLRIGLAFTMGDQDALASADIASEYTGATLIDFDTGGGDAVFFEGDRQRMGFELSYITGPFSLRAEYVQAKVDAFDGTVEETLNFSGMYVQATYLLTGEAKTLENRIKPKNNFDPLNGSWGAFELALRYATLEVKDAFDATGTVQFLDTGLVPPGATDPNAKVTEITAGLNWWFSQNVRWMLNYELMQYDESIAPVAGEEKDDDTCFYTRLQIDF